MTTLIIARHGNTFMPNQTPTRVGVRTDFPLVESGEEQALRLGHYLKAQNLIPDMVFTSTLRRTIDTARLVCVAMMCTAENSALPFLNEIDYGPDENQTEDKVVARLGQDAIKSWDEQGVMPDGWFPRPEDIIANWQDFLKRCEQEWPTKTILLVTSNGIARFALKCAANGHDFPLKLSTGACGILKFQEKWMVTDWNIRP